MSTFIRTAKGRLLMIALTLCVATAALFAMDYLVLRLKGSTAARLGSVTVHRYYRIGLKNGKTEIQYDGDYVYDCVHSLFPHFGDAPCWYLSRKTEQWVDIQSGTPNNPHIF